MIRCVMQCLDCIGDFAPDILADCRLSVHGPPYAHYGHASESRDVGDRGNFAAIETPGLVVDLMFFHLRQRIGVYGKGNDGVSKKNALSAFERTGHQYPIPGERRRETEKSISSHVVCCKTILQQCIERPDSNRIPVDTTNESAGPTELPVEQSARKIALLYFRIQKMHGLVVIIALVLIESTRSRPRQGPESEPAACHGTHRFPGLAKSTAISTCTSADS